MFGKQMGSGKGQDDVHDDNNMAGLVLGLGYDAKPTETINSSSLPESDYRQQQDQIVKKKLSLKFDNDFPSLALGLVSDDQTCPSVGYTCKIEDEKTDDRQHHMRSLPASSASAATSFSNSCSIKRDREVDVEAEAEMAEVELERVSSRVSDDHDRDQEDDQDDHDQASPRKKLRLTKEQSSVLEESFKDNTTLNSKQKQELAKRLNLRPRQVEVWFQNRRARTKLKQTEVECELLKKCCEKLAEENKRLMKELQELKSIKSAAQVAPFYMQLQAAATLTICPSCDLRRHPPSPITRPKPQLISNAFNHPSATCFLS